MFCLALVVGSAACGRKGNPIPRPRAAPLACTAQWSALRTLEIVLPTQDVGGDELVGLEKIRVYFLPIGSSQPAPAEVIARGEVVLEKRRPDLPAPGRTLTLDLSDVSRPAGWMVVSAVRLGDVVGAPSDVLLWLDPKI